MIPKDVMESLLIICTTDAPFFHTDEAIYRQKEGVGMGSPLGPTFFQIITCVRLKKIYCSVSPKHIYMLDILMVYFSK